MTKPVAATPLVRKLAAKHAIDLGTITGSGAGGRITPGDVQAAVNRKLGAGGGPRDYLQPLSNPGARPSLVRTRRSYFNHHVEVKVDEYAVNPLMDDVRQAEPDTYRLSLQYEPRVPTLFESGDVPLFTAAGFDPAVLLRLPWAVRHLAASTTNGATVAEIFDKCSSGTDLAVDRASLFGLDHPGNGSYERRVNTWRATTPPATRALVSDVPALRLSDLPKT